MEQVEILRDEIWVLKRTTDNNWMGENKIKTHYTRVNGEATKTTFCVPLDSITGKPKDIFETENLSEEETEEYRECLAHHLRLSVEDLYPGSEWLNEKSVTLVGALREFNLLRAEDYLDHLIVKMNNSVTIGDKYRANAEYAFTCESERIAKDVKKREHKADGYILLKQLNREEKESILVALGYNTAGMSQVGVEDAIGREVEGDPKRVIDIFNLPTFKAIVFVRKALESKILTYVGQSVFYNENLIGISIEGAASWMLDPKNKTAKDAIKMVLQDKKVL